MTSREQFEAFLQDEYGYQPSYIADKRESYGYNRSLFQGLWLGWKASRAALEINPPKFVDSREALSKGFTVDYSKGFGDGMDAYEESIRAAGIKVKGE